MEDNSININKKNSIMVSRNSPIALVVGVAGFLGSHLADSLLDKGIQVVGIDDFSSGKKINLEYAIKNKNFHLINSSIDEPLNIKLPRLDYAFLTADSFYRNDHNSKGLYNFLDFIKNLKEDKSKISAEKPRVILVSTIDLYNNKLSSEEKNLKSGEIKFAKFVKYYKINARIVRLSSLFGPRMHFRENDPVVRLIQASLLDNLQNEQTSLDFTSRSLYISDAVNLLIKAVLLGGTSQKIYDGSLIQPVKVSEIKQILLDPVWHDLKRFKPTELPPWLTPNLSRTVKELGWKPKTNIVEELRDTITYFKDRNINIPKEEETEPDLKKWSFKSPVYMENDSAEEGTDKKTLKEKNKKKSNINFLYSIQANYLTFIALFLIISGLLLPIIQLGVGIFNIKNHVISSAKYLETGDFTKAQGEIGEAKKTLSDVEKILNSLEMVKRLGILNEQINNLKLGTDLAEDSLEGISHTILGTQALFETTKVISGESNSDPSSFYQTAQSELTTASQKIALVNSKLSNQEFKNKLPVLIRPKAEVISSKLVFYADLIEKARAASFLMPQITAVNSNKTYLVLLENNLELRSGGGFIGSYAKLNFENGRIKDIKVDDIYNLDGGLKDILEPPQEIKNDLGQNRLYLRDSNFEPDFPTSAREAEFLYKKESRETVNGVFALDLSGSGKLLSSVGGLDLPEYGEHVDGNNLFEKAITHAEVNFFPGSQSKKNYLTSLELQLFNKIFYLSKQNWPEIIKAVGQSLDQKHLQVYLADPELFSYLVSENWAGVIPRGTNDTDNQFVDFLAPVEANYGANKVNFYLTRRYKLDTQFGKEGQIYHKLTINYKNSSPSEVFPAGRYKNRFKIYLPIGTKLTKALWGETDITSQFTTFSDYGRAGYSTLLELNPKDQKSLILDYYIARSLEFKDKTANYRLDIIKQAGTDKDQFEWNITYPINFQLNSSNTNIDKSSQEFNISTDLLQDRSLMLDFKLRQ